MLEQAVLETVAGLPERQMDVEPETTTIEPQLPSTHELPTEDGIPMETPLHRAQMNLCIEMTDYHWRERTDYYVGGNMFVYFSTAQVRNRDYRGPDFFIVTDVDGSQERDAWVVWEEGGRYPDLIIELLSDSTTQTDKITKKRLYERTFRTFEYFCYHPFTHELLGWRLVQNDYQSIRPNAHGHLWSELLESWLGTAESRYQRQTRKWLRFFDVDGTMVLTLAEAEAQRAEQETQRAEQESQRAEQESQRADNAEAEVARLQAELARLRGEG